MLSLCLSTIQITLLNIVSTIVCDVFILLHELLLIVAIVAVYYN